MIRFRTNIIKERCTNKLIQEQELKDSMTRRTKLADRQLRMKNTGQQKLSVVNVRMRKVEEKNEDEEE